MSSERTEGQPQEGKKVALLGFAESYKLAPFDDPTVEIWGLNELHKYVTRWDRWFEVHDGDTLGISKRDLSEGEEKRHLEWLSKDYGPNRPIYMQPQFCGGRFPNAVPWPLDEMSRFFKRGRYFTSSIAMMLGTAIRDGYTWIGLFGIDLASDIEYQDQRPCAEYYVGVADGIQLAAEMHGFPGVEVYIAPTSAMCKAGHVYAFEKSLKANNPILDAVRAHQATLKKKHDESLAVLNTLDGALQETENFLKLHEYKERGVNLPTY